MTELATFIAADEALTKVVQQIKDDQWDMEMPKDFPTGDPSRTYTLRTIMVYHAYDEAWIPAMLAGKTMKEVGEDAFGGPYDNTLLGDTPKENYAKLSAKAIQAVRDFPADELDSRKVHYSYGDFSARQALWHAILFRALRAHDIAKVLGLNSQLPEDLVQAVWDIVTPHAEEWRAMGIFGPKVEVSDAAPLQDRLLGLTGRNPS